MGKFRCRFSKPSAAWNRPSCALQIVLREKGGKMVPVALRDVEGLLADNIDSELWWNDHRIIVLEVWQSPAILITPINISCSSIALQAMQLTKIRPLAMCGSTLPLERILMS